MSIEVQNKLEQVNTQDVSPEQEKKLETVEKTDGKNLSKNLEDQYDSQKNAIDKETDTINTVENQETHNKIALFKLAETYIKDPNFGVKWEDFDQIKDLLLKTYPKDFTEKELSSPRKIESAMKKKVSEFTKYLAYNKTEKQEWLTEQELNTIKQKVSKQWPTSEYLFDGKMRYEKTGEKITKIDWSQIVGEWNFVAKDTSYEDSNTLSLVKDNVQKLQTQLAQIKNNPNIDPNSIRVVIHSSASNLKYTWEWWNQALATQRAQNVQKLIWSNFWWLTPQMDISTEVAWPAYPPKIEDLQKAWFNAQWKSLQDIVTNYQDPVINKMLEEQLYRPYQKVEVSLDYKEIKKEPLYTVESQNLWFKWLEKMPLNTVVNLVVDKSVISQIDPKEREKIIDSISDPYIKADFQKNFVNNNYSWFKFRINTWFTNANDLFDLAIEWPNNMKNYKEAAKNTWSQPLYQYQWRDVNDNANVEYSKVTTKEIKDISTFRKLLDIVGNANSTDKELINFVKGV